MSGTLLAFDFGTKSIGVAVSTTHYRHRSPFACN